MGILQLTPITASEHYFFPPKVEQELQEIHWMRSHMSCPYLPRSVLLS